MSEQPRIPTTRRLAEALARAGAPRAMIERALDGVYDDFKSEVYAAPIMALLAECRAAGLHSIAERAKAGEFEAADWESDAWATSEEGQATMRELFGGSPPWH